MSKQEAEDFQNWLWGQMYPQTFLTLWGTVTYKFLGMLCGVSESTVQHWFADPNARSYKGPPADRYQRTLILMDWWLETFEFTPEQLLAQFEQNRQRLSEK